MILRIAFLTALACVLFSSKAHADDSWSYTKMTMAEAKSLIKIGMSESEVREKVGKPTLIQDVQEPGTSWIYCAAPPGTPGYGGFVVIFKGHKVTNLDAIYDPTH